VAVQGPSRANGTYHAELAQQERTRRTRLLIGVGAGLSLVALVQVFLINGDMTRIEQSGPERLALAGDAVAHFVPSILANFQRAQQPANTVVNTEGDPRHSVPFVRDKQALERWAAVTMVGLAVLFIGLESRIPDSTATPRSPTGSDLSRLLILLALSYGALSIFESG
jgi:hypothetical protein